MTISNLDNVIDSRDVIARIEELESEQAAYLEEIKEATTEEDKAIAQASFAAWEDEEGNELDALRNLAEEASQYSPDWQYGEVLIHEDYFTDYAMELLQDIGDLPTNIPSYLVIDEEATAENIKQDYTAVDFDGETYWIR